jgi:hypothetical protein
MSSLEAASMVKGRRVWCGLCAALVLLAGSSAVLILIGGDAICRATAERIEEGMTFEEVKAVIGRPPGVYGSREYPLKTMVLQAFVATKDCKWWKGLDDYYHGYYWIGDRGIIDVRFLAERVVGVEFHPSGAGLLDQLKDWLGW